jgi:hypothetical protein
MSLLPSYDMHASSSSYDMHVFSSIQGRHEPSAQTVTSLISYDAPHLRRCVLLMCC